MPLISAFAIITNHKQNQYAQEIARCRIIYCENKSNELLHILHYLSKNCMMYIKGYMVIHGIINFNGRLLWYEKQMKQLNNYPITVEKVMND